MTQAHPIVSSAQYVVARLRLLAAVRELTQQRAALAAQRCALPWVKTEKSYRFESADGPVALAELFQGQVSCWSIT